MNHQELVELAQESKTRIQEITIDEAQKAIAEKDVIILDVRETDEYESGHLADTLHLSLGEVKEQIHNVIKDKSTKIICYCGGGNRSALATDTLNQLGYENVVSLMGGITAWENSGKEVIRN
ncbi:rhodanese domain protein [Geminocystis sp. NIES-3708]|nr:rhodanese domain protein [Geminocystis sp. NIES-3708]